jgi:hypothetical protein
MLLSLRSLACVVAATVFASCVAMADDSTPAWSKPVNGLRARLFTLPTHDPGAGRTYDLWIEFEDVGVETGQELDHSPVEIYYMSDNSNLHLVITDAKGSNIPPTGAPIGDVIAGPKEFVVPAKGKLAFPILPGGPKPTRSVESPADGTRLTLNIFTVYLIPFDRGPCHIAATFENSILMANRLSHLSSALFSRNWTGTLELPPIELPAR